MKLQINSIAIFIKNYIMGCGSCIIEHHHSQVSKIPLQQRRKAILSKIQLLKPSQLVSQELLDTFLEDIEPLIYSKQNRKILQMQQPITQQQQATIKSTILSWKSLVFCSGQDLYQDHLFIDFTLKHKCFDDIQKDIERTFPDIQKFQSDNVKSQFKQTLQKLGLYFPLLGYTQGTNFIVGYLLAEGFNKQDTFWMVVHLFLKKQFLFLGFFQDGFPLSEIYCKLFRFLLQRQCKTLYQHLNNLNISEKVWVFKWFITTYIYSFPFQAIKDIWDYMMVAGGLGLIYFAVSLTKSLQPHLMALQQDVQIIQFFTSLRQPQTFKSLINLPFVLLNSYTIKLSDSQISTTVNQLHKTEGFHNVYVDYFKNYQNHLQRDSIIKEWHKSKRNERYQFFLKPNRNSKLNWKNSTGGFRVEKQQKEKQVVMLPKILKAEPTNTIPIKVNHDYTNLRDKVYPIHLCKNLSDDKEIGQYTHKISFKKKKNIQNQDGMGETPQIKKQHSQKVLPKTVPKRINRKQSKLSTNSRISQESSQLSQHISVVKIEFKHASSGTIEQSIQQFCAAQTERHETESVK